VGRAVAFALEGGRELHELTLEELRRFAPEVDGEIFSLLTLERMIDRRTSHGGTATGQVTAAIADARRRLDEEDKEEAP